MSGYAPNRSLTYWWIAIAVFAACFSAVGSLNRIASDDFEFLRVFRESGAWDATMFFRDTWNTRWSAILWLNGWFGIYETTGSLLPYHLFTICCLMLSSGFLLHTLFRRTGLPTVQITLLAGCWSAALFYGSFSIPDTWFWANTSTMYGWTHVYGMLAAGVLLSERSDWRAILLLLIAGIGIGGGNEPFAVSVLLCCMVVLSPISSKITGISFISKRPVLLFFAVTLSAFLFAYTGQGHSVRSSLLPDPGIASQLWVLVKSMVKLLAIHIPSRLLPLLLLLFPFYLIGTQFPAAVRKAVVVKVLAVFALLCVLSIAPVVWLMSEMGPERAWSQVTLYTVTLVAFLWFAAGTHRPVLRQFSRLYSAFGILAVLFIAATGTTAVMKAKTYSNAWDERMHLLEKYQNGAIATPDTIRLEPLPPPGWLHSAEIESYPEHFTNVHLKQFTGLRSAIVTERSTPPNP